MPDPTTAEQAVELLNELCETDAEALAALIDHRVPCSDTLGEHPTVQVGHVDYDPARPLDVGLLGILNGLFGVRSTGGGWIGAHYELSCSSDCEPTGLSGEVCGTCGATIELGRLAGFSIMKEKDCA